jgi:two-component system phosphate regulon response regulator PhoB
VDDEPDILRLIEIKLAKAGFEVLIASDGEEGLRLALTEKPALMIVDVMMPGLDGYQVVAQAKERLGDEAPLAIFLTAKGQESDVVQAFASGADDYLMKPFSPQELVERITITLMKAGRFAGHEQ